MFGRNSMNVSVGWLGVPDFLRTNGPAWTANILDPHLSWGDGGSITNTNWGGQSGGYSGSVSVPWNFPVRVLPVYHRMIYGSMRASARPVCDNLLRGIAWCA